MHFSVVDLNYCIVPQRRFERRHKASSLAVKLKNGTVK